jgi:polyribonucleotide nucleotidyltransferase
LFMENRVKAVEAKLGNLSLALKTGHVAFQADGAVTLTYGNTVLLATATMSSQGKPGQDFFPLLVDYQERYYAGGKMKGSRFIKREGRPADEAILTARMTDRPIRPLFPKGMTNDVVITIMTLSSDGSAPLGHLAITAASAACAVGDLPVAKTIAGVRIGRMGGEFIVDPTWEQVEEGDLDLVVAGSSDAITMVEAGAREISDEDMIKALQIAHEEIKKMCKIQDELKAQVGKQLGKEPTVVLPADEVMEEVSAALTDADLDGLYHDNKPAVYAALDVLNAKVLEQFASKIEDDALEAWTEGDVKECVDKAFKKYMRKSILESGKRLDGRGTRDVRPINVGVGFLPRTHGTGLFQRGETQILSILTLAGPGAKQILDPIDRAELKKRYLHHYNFPGYSVGEARGSRGVGRREIGHGFLAERALEHMIPAEEDFPYVMRVVSETLSCNGSSSMGSVCGSTLALMDGGVPIKAPVAGIAMGMVTDDETGKYQILSDIQGMEDFAGDMDFKYCATDKGITALQMDIKLTGISIERITEAMTQAREGRDFIWGEMAKVIAVHRDELSPNAPMIEKIKIDPSQIGMIIGKGGETIQGITEECGVEIDIEDSGLVFVTAPNKEAGQKAIEIIKQILYVPSEGDELEGTVVRIVDFGAFVELTPSTDGLIHISQLAEGRTNNVSDVVKEGEKVLVKVVKVENGKIGLKLLKKL